LKRAEEQDDSAVRRAPPINVQGQQGHPDEPQWGSGKPDDPQPPVDPKKPPVE
jgi:hypothetical protein